MGKKRILTVGFGLASPDAEYRSFWSQISLLDYDIVLFRPEIWNFVREDNNYYYQGKPCLSDRLSFELRACSEHWRREIRQAFDTDKTIIIYLSDLVEVFIATGERSSSGTGKNRKTTRIVEPYNNYYAIPFPLSPVKTSGSAMKLSTRGSEVLAPYWKEFERDSQYKVLLTEDSVSACLLTRAGDKTVGAVYRSKVSSGAIFLLPDIDFYKKEFTKLKQDKRIWTTEANQFANRMVASIVALDKALKSTQEMTPEPSWASESQFILASEKILRIQLLDAEKQVEQAQKRKEEIVDMLRSAGSFRALLYEKGKPLEAVIIDTLRLFGFKAEPYKDSASEFDVVFESSEGRFIGEVGGKDKKAIDIKKLRQASTNIHEDHQRVEIEEPAKPVLFGNGFRLQPLQDRPDPFTEKCYSTASSTSTALVFTPDLFLPVQYLLETRDHDYALACRQVILLSTGRVKFPAPPLRAELQKDIETTHDNLVQERTLSGAS